VLPPLPESIAGVGECYHFKTPRGCRYHERCQFYHITPRWAPLRPCDAALIARWERESGVTLPVDRDTNDAYEPHPSSLASSAVRRCAHLGMDVYAQHAVRLLDDPPRALAAAADARGFVPATALESAFLSTPGAPPGAHYTGAKFCGWLSRLRSLVVTEWRGPDMWVALVTPQHQATHAEATRSGSDGGRGGGGSGIDAGGSTDAGGGSSGWAQPPPSYAHAGSSGDGAGGGGGTGLSRNSDAGGGASRDSSRYALARIRDRRDDGRSVSDHGDGGGWGHEAKRARTW
jgi:hypothetical protein